MNILSIQSSVAYGYAGNSAAVFPLQRLGVEVWPVLTVHFSNNTSYDGVRGPLLRAADISEVVQGIEDRGVLGDCDAVLSGYQGAEEVGQVVLQSVAKVKGHNPEAVYCCDPVMGDVGRGFFVRPGIPEFMRDQVVPACDIATPNQFELDFLTGRETATMADVLAAADQLREVGPHTVLVTSVRTDDDPADTLGMAAVSPDGAWVVRTPELPLTPTGTGDVTAALFLAHLLGTQEAPTALARTASSVFGILQATADLGRREIALVAAQDVIADPPMQFDVTPLR
ncbi:MAG: Pyridoxal kinase [uncultured Nocardioidaceae bacterium]|uniref:pyridoxal kinase n=1 Tax=uncultured Nocardioidaceae bacterium TaxID=253824 RepID=A0A6J4MMG3_9ACTN|nr:MAG: Pyridoxal kinase [uncultured Nocardioidaceae bacterium]